MPSKKSPRKAAKKTVVKTAAKPTAKPKKPAPQAQAEACSKTGTQTEAHAQSSKPAVTAYTLITEPDQGLTAIYNLIATATKSIDMTMYQLTDVTVMDAFTSAASKGIAVARHPGPKWQRENDQHAGVQLP